MSDYTREFSPLQRGHNAEVTVKRVADKRSWQHVFCFPNTCLLILFRPGQQGPV